MKNLIRVVDIRTGKKIIIGVNQIVSIKETVYNFKDTPIECTEIISSNATNYVKESVEEIYNLQN